MKTRILCKVVTTLLRCIVLESADGNLDTKGNKTFHCSKLSGWLNIWLLSRSHLKASPHVFASKFILFVHRLEQQRHKSWLKGLQQTINSDDVLSFLHKSQLSWIKATLFVPRTSPSGFVVHVWSANQSRDSNSSQHRETSGGRSKD